MIHESTDTLLDVADVEEDQRQVLREERKRACGEFIRNNTPQFRVRVCVRELTIGTKLTML